VTDGEAFVVDGDTPAVHRRRPENRKAGATCLAPAPSPTDLFFVF
jgi:hypothetical protein